MAWRIEDLDPLVYDSASFEDREVVGEAVGNRHVMGDEELITRGR